MPLIQMRLVEFMTVEKMAAIYLKSASVVYYDLPKNSAWVILVGSYFAMMYAEQFRQIPDELVADYIPEQFAAFLKFGMSAQMFYSIYRGINDIEESDAAKRFRELLIEQGSYSNYEAVIRSIAKTINVLLETEHHYGENAVNWNQSTEDALYRFYLCARDNYFQGE